MTQQDDLALAVRLVQEAAAVADGFFRRGVDVRVKGAPGNVVSDADLAAEEHVRALLQAERPADGILGEEGASADGARRWLVDAVDGTLNFVRGDPFWCTAVALQDPSGGDVAAVHHVASGETFSAGARLGCRRNDELLELGDGRPLGDAVLATYLHPGDGETETVGRALRAVASPRIRGSGSLELAWLAAGRIDAWLQRDVQPWDLAPGRLLVREAGGVCETVRNDEGAWTYAAASTAAADLRAVI